MLTHVVASRHRCAAGITETIGIVIEASNIQRNGFATIVADHIVGAVAQSLKAEGLAHVVAPAGVGSGRLGIAADTGIAALEHTIRFCLIIFAILIKGLDKMVGAINRGIAGAGFFKVSSGSKCSGDHGHCHHSGQNDRCNPRNSLLSQFHKTTSKIFCVSEKEESLSRYNTFLFFWQMPALSMQEVRKNCQRNKFKSADALLRKMPGAVLRSGRPAGPAGSDPAAFRPGSCPAQRRRTPDRFQLVAPSVCAPPLRSRFSGSLNLHIIH